jgi:hypothetical protein
MAGEESDDRQARAVRRAATLVTEAMDLLDAHGGAPEAAAHLDLALASLRQRIGGSDEGQSTH